MSTYDYYWNLKGYYTDTPIPGVSVMLESLGVNTQTPWGPTLLYIFCSHFNDYHEKCEMFCNCYLGVIAITSDANLQLSLPSKVQVGPFWWMNGRRFYPHVKISFSAPWKGPFRLLITYLEAKILSFKEISSSFKFEGLNIILTAEV